MPLSAVAPHLAMVVVGCRCDGSGWFWVWAGDGECWEVRCRAHGVDAALVAVDGTVCEGCDGACVRRDPDGSLTGTPGAVVPCECQAQVWGNEVCACFVPVWPGDSGFSGWVPTGGLIGTEPVYDRCPTHGAELPAAIASGLVAA